MQGGINPIKTRLSRKIQKKRMELTSKPDVETQTKSILVLSSGLSKSRPVDVKKCLLRSVTKAG